MIRVRQCASRTTDARYLCTRPTLLSLYEQQAKDGKIWFDASQRTLIEKLDHSTDEIILYFDKYNQYWKEVNQWEQERQSIITNTSVSYSIARRKKNLIEKYNQVINPSFVNSFEYKKQYFLKGLAFSNKSWKQIHQELIMDVQKEIINFDIQFEQQSKVKPMPNPPAPPKSLYLYGHVGTGKTMLMRMLNQRIVNETRNSSSVPFSMEPDEISTQNFTNSELFGALPVWSPFTSQTPPPFRVVWTHFSDFLRKIFRIMHYFNCSVREKQEILRDNLPDTTSNNTFLCNTTAACLSSINGYILERDPPNRLSNMFTTNFSEMEHLFHRIRLPPMLLFLDELQMIDSGDSSVIRALFNSLIANGSIIVTSCNLPPHSLCQNHLNRDFQAFISTIEQNFGVFSLPAENVAPDVITDYRFKHYQKHQESYAEDQPSGKLQQLFFVNKKNETGTSEFELLFKKLIGDGQLHTNYSLVIPHYKRDIIVPQCCLEKKIARFTFDELCSRELSSVDYSTLVAQFSCIVVDEIPQLSVVLRNQVRRFISFVDQVYNQKAVLICSSAEPIESLFKDRISDFFDAQQIMESLQFERTDNHESKFSTESLAHFQGKNENFAFSRALSRLREFQTRYWLESSTAEPEIVSKIV